MWFFFFFPRRALLTPHRHSVLLADFVTSTVSLFPGVLWEISPLININTHTLLAKKRPLPSTFVSILLKSHISMLQSSTLFHSSLLSWRTPGAKPWKCLLEIWVNHVSFVCMLIPTKKAVSLTSTLSCYKEGKDYFL